MARGRRVLLLAALTVAVAGGGSAGGATREYSTGPLDHPIPDVGTLDVPLRVLQHGSVSFLAVELQIDHPRDSDLTLSLVAPAGATVVLSAKRGDDAGDYGTGRACGFELPMFRDDGFTPIASAKPPFGFDTYIPEQPLRTLYGIDAAGVWKLRISDDRAGAAGAVRCFRLTVSRSVIERRTAVARGTAAELSYVERNSRYLMLRLRIARRGRTLFDAPPHRVRPYGDSTTPVFWQSGGPVRVRDLDGDGEPEVLVDLYWGGAHCCYYTDVYRYVRARGAYRLGVGFWGDLHPTLRDLDGDGRPEFETGDDRFAYVFTGFATSVFPIRILRFDHGRFVDATRRFRRLIRRDAAKLYALYRSERRKPNGDVGGILPAWLADEYLLGRGPAGWPVLREAVRRGEIQPWESPRSYLRKVRFFLRRTGYIRGRA
jgi:subtilisin-like proprotein convertase family protein